MCAALGAVVGNLLLLLLIVAVIVVVIVVVLHACGIEYPHISLMEQALPQNNILTEARNGVSFTLLTVVKQP